MPPNDTPVSNIEKNHSCFLPYRRDNGIQSGTEKAEGIMYDKIMRGAHAAAPTTYCAT